ncbi:MAG: hypothetical protein J0I33_13845 [Microbacterium ginsengisoli]|uniref:hypothetical protein n=1 Tax=Microbacterium TaxID=33882 RepID=UPI0007010A58|nr:MULTISPECIES: hypothetical protein [unclassified Microbacterium]KQR90991.1 hypothetical protein ASF93_08730 [Microbacterium sp. Leaf347]KQS00011.1 hypothetical protein ASG00_10990 [Microbacterium sp. Leaf351]MBN9199713.1 hypothetical protein [Microbacterium ginsengisoli]OJU75240.1 MAG: hypothetical protein BGO15_04225 [Microbacterium sp. 71-23]
MSIEIPTDAKPSRIHRPEPAPTEDDVRETLAEYERLAMSTGAMVRIDPPEFASPDASIDWAPWWLGDEPPQLVRVTVWRNGIQTQVYRAWQESLPVDPVWQELWRARPMTFFGASGIRAALRRAYRDVIGDHRQADDVEPDAPEAVTPEAVAPAPQHDWRPSGPPIPAAEPRPRTRPSAPRPAPVAVPHAPRTELRLDALPVKPGSKRKAASRGRRDRGSNRGHNA